MLEQYFGMKIKHPEAILLSRVGDFYEAYGEDAEIDRTRAADRADEQRGRRRAARGDGRRSASRACRYLARFVQQRFIVALAEQLEVPQPNRLVRRDVVRLVTPGTLIEENCSTAGRTTISPQSPPSKARWRSLTPTCRPAFAPRRRSPESTRTRNCSRNSGASRRPSRRGPSRRFACHDGAGRRSTRGAARLAAARRVEVRPRGLLDGFSHDESLAVHRALDALAAFVKRTGVAGAAHGDGVDQRPNLYRRQAFMSLDRGDAQAFGVGSRGGTESERDAARDARPLCDVDGLAHAGALDCRAAVDRKRWRRGKNASRSRCASTLAGMRCASCSKAASTSSASRSASASGAPTRATSASLRRTLEALQPLRGSRRAVLGVQFDRIARLRGLLDDLRRTLVDDPPALLGDGGAFVPRPTPNWRNASLLRTDARSRLSELEERERERTGIKTLQDQVRERVRLRDRGEQGARRQRAARLRAQADADDRRALRDARTQRIGTGDLDGAGTPGASRASAFRGIGRARSQRGPTISWRCRSHRRARRVRVARAVRGRTWIRAPAFVDESASRSKTDATRS